MQDINKGDFVKHFATGVVYKCVQDSLVNRDRVYAKRWVVDQVKGRIVTVNRANVYKIGNPANEAA